MRCLVTGAAGFLGSHLLEQLLDRGCEVIGLDNGLTGNFAHLANIQNHPSFTLLERNVSEPITLEGPLDWIFHFASPASPKDYAQYPIPTLKAGSLGTYYLLGLAKKKGAHFFLASTSEVYGDPLVHPQPESYWGNVNPIGLRSVYDEAKRFAEAMTVSYHRTHGIDIRIARIFNTYGPRMRLHDGRVIPNFITQALTGKPITVYGKGRQTRSFCFVKDLIQGILGLMQVEEPFPVNLGNPKEITVLALAQTIIQLTASTSPVVYEQLPEDDPKQRCPDIRRAKELFHFSPSTSLEEGLRQTIPYFREKLL